MDDPFTPVLRISFIYTAQQNPQTMHAAGKALQVGTAVSLIFLHGGCVDGSTPMVWYGMVVNIIKFKNFHQHCIADGRSSLR